MRKQLCRLLALHAGKTIDHALSVEMVGTLFPPDPPDPPVLPAWEPMTRPALDELLCGDIDAVNFYRCVAHCTHTYDDLVDKDKPVSQGDLHAFVWRLLFEIPLNPFFDKHQHTLRPLLMTGILNWIAANEMEQSGSREELRVAHVIRYSAGDILLASMALTGGIEHARTHARRARLMLQDETWRHYSTEKKGPLS